MHMWVLGRRGLLATPVASEAYIVLYCIVLYHASQCGKVLQAMTFDNMPAQVGKDMLQLYRQSENLRVWAY